MDVTAVMTLIPLGLNLEITADDFKTQSYQAAANALRTRKRTESHMIRQRMLLVIDQGLPKICVLQPDSEVLVK